MTLPDGRIIVLTGPTGAGKSTLAKGLLKSRRLVLEKVPTCTTRARRPGEMPEIDYHFLTPEKFEGECTKGKIIVPCKFAGHHYGTRKSEVDSIVNGGGNALVTLELSGAKSIREIYPGAEICYIWAAAGVLYERARARGTPVEEVDKRLRQEAPLSKSQAEKLGFHFIDNSGPAEETLKSIVNILAR